MQVKTHERYRVVAHQCFRVAVSGCLAGIDFIGLTALPRRQLWRANPGPIQQSVAEPTEFACEWLCATLPFGHAQCTGSREATVHIEST
jgi:hypothetical protein